MPLNLDARGVLPDGIHDATLDEIEECFGRYTTRDARANLFKRLRLYVEAVRATKWKCELLIDGSFVMSAICEPEDIDAVIAYPPEIEAMIEADELKPYQFNVIDKKYCQREYKIDLKPCTLKSDRHSFWVTFFANVTSKRVDEHKLPTGSTKGLVRVIL